MKKIVLLVVVLVLLSTLMLGTRGVITVSGSTTHHVYPGDSIQEAINSASPGDTILVHSGTYYENVIVNKTVSLIGENRSTTIIDGNATGNVIAITANNVNVRGFTIQNSATSPYFRSGIYVGSSGNDISHNIITNNYHGISLEHSNYNTLIGNNVSNNDCGIYSYDSGENILNTNLVSLNYYGIVLSGISFRTQPPNILTDNTISSNYLGIRLQAPALIFHNNFVNNYLWQADCFVDNILDNGYPSGGNYWSDYAGNDTFSGPYQNEIGSDGIGDTPYIIAADGNLDWFPLMGSINIFNAGMWDGITYYVHTVSNSTISDFYFSRDDKLLGFNVTGSDGTVGFCRVTIPKELLWCDNPEQWEVWVNNTLIEDKKIMEDINYAYIYFTYNHTTQTVIVVGTSVIPIPPNADAGPDQSVFKGMTVTFDGSNSTDNVGIASYTWSFVDVTLKTLTDEKPKYTFNNVGDFEVTLNVSDYTGYWDADTIWIHVLPDTTKPSIGIVSQEPDGTQVSYWDIVTITVDVTDDESGVSNATLSYSTDGGETWTNVTMQKTTGDTYQGKIPGLPIGTNVRYKITAYDNAENFAVDDNAGEYYVFFTVIPEFPGWISMLLILMVLTVATAIYKRRLLKTPIH